MKSKRLHLLNESIIHKQQTRTYDREAFVPEIYSVEINNKRKTERFKNIVYETDVPRK